jgi:uncharacterized YccA/Bax inhibitor family protein
MRNSGIFGSGNPLMSDKAFSEHAYGNPMTIGGTLAKTAFSFMILGTTAAAAWVYQLEALMIPAAIFAFVVAMITIFNKQSAGYTTPIYAALEGVVLGSISHVFERMYPGIVPQAVLATLGVLGTMLALYTVGIIRPTQRFKSVVMAATGGIAIMYMINFVMSFFGGRIHIINDATGFGIGFSVFVAVIAALNLIFDFEMIEVGAKRGAPKYMEWYSAFSLMVTLVWLYLEILRLLSKIQRRK